MKKIMILGLSSILISGCGDTTTYDTLSACNEIPLVSRDSELCSCYSESFGGSKESVDLMKWLASDKANDEAGFQMAGWLMVDIMKDETRNNQLEELLKSLGEEDSAKFMACNFGT